MYDISLFLLKKQCYFEKVNGAKFYSNLIKCKQKNIACINFTTNRCIAVKKNVLILSALVYIRVF